MRTTHGQPGPALLLGEDASEVETCSGLRPQFLRPLQPLRRPQSVEAARELLCLRHLHMDNA